MARCRGETDRAASRLSAVARYPASKPGGHANRGDAAHRLRTRPVRHGNRLAPRLWPRQGTKAVSVAGGFSQPASSPPGTGQPPKAARRAGLATFSAAQPGSAQRQGYRSAPSVRVASQTDAALPSSTIPIALLRRACRMA